MLHIVQRPFPLVKSFLKIFLNKKTWFCTKKPTFAANCFLSVFYGLLWLNKIYSNFFKPQKLTLSKSSHLQQQTLSRLQKTNRELFLNPQDSRHTISPPTFRAALPSEFPACPPDTPISIHPLAGRALRRPHETRAYARYDA